MLHRWQVICFYQGKRQPRFTVLDFDNAKFWCNWVRRTDPSSKPEIKEVLEDDYALEKKAN